jgi:hypothetical protein
MKRALLILASLALAIPTAALAAPQATPDGDRLLNLAEAKQTYSGRLSGVVLEFLTVMDRVVNQPKEPRMTPAAWAPLGELVDQEKFRRIGNYGVRNDWPSYAGLLTMWSNSSWWKGYIWRMTEVPDQDGGGLVYLETEERSNLQHPVREDGDYSTLASIAVYRIDANGKIIRLHVYDQRPLDN